MPRYHYSASQIATFRDCRRKWAFKTIDKIDGAPTILNGPNPLVVVLENDRAKVLGQSLAVQRGRRDDVVCIDGVHTGLGDYIDIGAPVGAGQAVPVVVKTLVFND